MAAADPAGTDQVDRNRWWGLVTISIGIAMIMVDATIVNVALPSMITSLDLTAADAEWTNTAYTLMFAALLLAAGRFGDVVGHQRLFLAGVLSFVLASILAGAANGSAVLILGRVLQGVGAAMILPATLSIINTTFRGRERAVAFGIWGAMISGTVALGPVVGGWLTTEHEWRWIFYINLPLGILVLVGGLLFVANSRDPQADLRVGIASMLTASIGFAALVLALIEGQRYGWWSPTRTFEAGPVSWPLDSVSPIPVAFLVAAACFLAVVRIERRRQRLGLPALVDPALFRIRSFRIGNIAVGLVHLGELGLIFVLPLLLQFALGYTAFGAGLVLVSLAAGALIAGPVAGPMTNRYGARFVVATGLAMEGTAAIGLAALTTADVDAWLIVLMLLQYGMGLGLASAQLSNVVLTDVPVAQSGQASGVQSTTRLIGSSLGIAILGTVLVTSLGGEFRDRLDEQNVPAPVASTVSAAARDSLGATIPQLSADPATAAFREPGEKALAAATRNVTYLAGGFMLVAFAVSLRLPRTPPAVRAPAGPRRRRRPEAAMETG